MTLERDENVCLLEQRAGVRLIITRSSHRSCSLRFPLKFRKLHKKTPVLETLFDNVAGPQPCNLFKKRLQHRWLPVKYAKFLEHLFWRISANAYFCISFFQFWSECEDIIFDAVCWTSGLLWKNNTKMEKIHEKQENRSQKKQVNF